MAAVPRTLFAAKSWQIANRGNPMPGPNMVSTAPAASGVDFSKNLLGVSSGDRALVKVDEARVHSKLAENAAKQHKSRAAFKAHVRLAMSAQGYKAAWESYRTTQFTALKHYGPRKANNDSANLHQIATVFSRGANTWARVNPTAYHRRHYATAFGVNPMKVEESEAKLKWSHPVKSDPFLRQGPSNQPYRKWDVNNTTSGKHYDQGGVSRNMGSWVHQNWSRQEGLVQLVDKQLRGMGDFYHSTGMAGRRKTQLMDWYRDLLHTPVPTLPSPFRRILNETRVPPPQPGLPSDKNRYHDVAVFGGARSVVADLSAAGRPSFGGVVGRMDRPDL
eukprot:TRINITY_DN9683_c0_g3_i1.p1 TRINITY_DN9683_c0_g3~~TRINITY_DN9683_c0_g3_i1.p1  ORF type:complete len:333 (+),score=72.33 TRINITY_DN9683_c0_g3_i1:127-1125(+)